MKKIENPDTNSRIFTKDIRMEFRFEKREMLKKKKEKKRSDRSNRTAQSEI